MLTSLPIRAPTLLAALLTTLALYGAALPSPADAARRTFRPAPSSTPRPLRFKLEQIDPREVRSARLYTAGGATSIRRAVVRKAIATGVLKIRRSRRQARSDRSRAPRRRGRPKLVIRIRRAGRGALTPISGRTYYVSAGGSDANSGRSRRAAWRTVRRVNTASLDAGDGVLFEGGRTFSDSALSPQRSGSARRPIVYGSYGSRQARLPEGVYLLDVSGLAVQNLEVSGAGQAVLASASGEASDITIERMTISDVAIAINSASDKDAGWTIRDNTISNIGDSGMILNGSSFSITGNSIVKTGIDGSIGYPKHGIYLKVVDARVRHNTIRGFQTSGVSVRYRNSVIEHNDIGDGRFGLAWHQYDPAAGTSQWRYNTISCTTVAGIYVSPEDIAGPTRESFVITNNMLSKRSGVYSDLEPTRGTYTVKANRKR